MPWGGADSLDVEFLLFWEEKWVILTFISLKPFACLIACVGDVMDGRKILIVEDNSLNLELATDLLELAGYTVFAAETAEDGIEKAETLRPDLVLMDIDLPGMDGLTATKTLKLTPATRDIKVVALTAFVMKGDEARTLESGCEGYLTKPISTRTFAAQVTAFLEGSGDS